MPSLDTNSVSSSQIGDTTTGKVASSPSSTIKPPIPWPKSSSEVITPQHEYDPGTSDPKRITPGDSQVRMSGMDSKDMTSRNGGLLMSITDPQMGEGDRSVPVRSADPSFVPSGIRDRTNRDGKSLTRSPADQWRSLVASSKASKESLAKSARERRLKRGSDPMLSRTSQEASILAQPRATTPEWRRRLIKMRSEPGGFPTIMRGERKYTSEETPRPTGPTPRARMKGHSPDRYSTYTPYRQRSQRSASKPMPGAIKAMAALFDNAIRESPGDSATSISGRARHSPRESNSFPRRDVVDESPTKSNLSRDNPESLVRFDDKYPRRNKGTGTETFTTKDRSPAPEAPRSDRTAPHEPAMGDLRVKSFRDILRPAKMLSLPRKEQRSSHDKPADKDRPQPPRLGTMVPHQEEPPVGHFVRPSSSASAQSLHPSAEGVSAPLDGAGARHGAGNNSILHAQIRSLRGQLERRNEAVLHLRRQLETQAHMDVGTLCEQLRLARREALMWRKRAEAAEKRVAVLQRIGAKFRALGDGDRDGDGDLDGVLGGDGGWDEDEDEDGSGSCSIQTGSQIRRCFAGEMGTGRDGAVFEEGDGNNDGGGDEYEFEEACIVRVGRGCELHRSTLRRTAKLWQAARENA